MKEIIIICLAILVLVILSLFVYIAAQFVAYIFCEIRHTIKKAKRTIKESWWDLEWRLAYNKRHSK